ncbi:hypothetical protein PG997_007521 [Apiospora hydei]|uniref:C2H2-type domain-containing protein n=1 Tax=Apiospora hydei TaxID=1337664 RepID=A0ABR1W896_9PEZI
MTTPPETPLEERGRSYEAPSQPKLRQRLPSPFSDDSDSSLTSGSNMDVDEDSTVASLNEVTKTVDLKLGRLVRTGVSICNTDNGSRLQEADSIFEPDEHFELQSYLETLLLSQRPHSVHYTYTPEALDPSQLGEVQRRLIHANLRRRNMLIYTQKHAEKPDAGPRALNQLLDADRTPGTGLGPALHAMDLVGVPMVSEVSTAPAPAPKPVIIRGVALSIKSGSTDSGISQLAYLGKSNGSRSIADSTRISQSSVKLHYPYPRSGEMTILLSDVPTAVRYFPPRCERHADGDHPTKEYWICYACIHNPRFEAEEALVSHTLDDHGKAISSRHMPLLRKTARKCTPAEVGTCPICNWPQSADFHVEESRPSSIISPSTSMTSLCYLFPGPPMRTRLSQ